MAKGENLGLRFRVGDLDLRQRRDLPVVGEEDLDAHIYLLVWHNNVKQDSHRRKMYNQIRRTQMCSSGR